MPRLLATCPVCGDKLPNDALDALCPKCVFVDSIKRLEDSQSSLDKLPTHISATYGYSPGSKFGDYELLEEIARGGMGIVFRARQISLDRIVAVKLLLLGPHANPEFVQRFHTEALTAASLQHPNLVAIHEVSFREGQHFLAMEYIAGRSLAQEVRAGPLPVRRAAGYVKTIAEAIHYAHERGILHRDLKPSNVLLDSFDQPKVTDFGLAKRLPSDSSSAAEHDSLTLTGQVLGSPNYMPPEQAAGRRGQTGKPSDVYSLGAILYHLLTGQPPFAAESVAETLHHVLHTEPAPPRTLNAGVPRDLETICLKCLEKDASGRYSTARELADDLRRFLRDEPIVARPAGRTEKAWLWARRNPGVATLTAAVALIFFVGVAIAVWQRQQRSKAASEAQTRRDLDQSRIYAADMKLAHAAYQAGKTENALQLLDRHKPQPGQPDFPPAFEWRWLYRLCLGKGEIIDHHTNFCGSIAYSTDKRTIAFGTLDGFIKLYDLSNRQPLKNWQAHAGFIRSVAFHPRHTNLLATVSGQDGLLKLWDIVSGRTLMVTNGPKGWWPNVAFSVNGRFLTAGAPDGRSLNLWELQSWTPNAAPVLTLRTNLPFTGPAAFSPDERTVAVCNNLAAKVEIALFDLISGNIVPFAKAHRDWIMCVAFSPDGSTVATGGADEFVVLRSMRDQTVFRRYTATGIINVTQIAFAPNNEILLASGLDQNIRFWRLNQPGDIETSSLPGHSGGINSLAVSPDGGSFASTGQDGTTRLWSLPGEDSISLSQAQTEFSTIVLRARKIGESQQRVRQLMSVVVGPDHRTAAVVLQETLVLCDLTSGAVLVSVNTTNVFDVAPTEIRSVAFSPDGRKLAVGGVNGRVVMLAIPTLHPLEAPIALHEGRITDIAFCINGTVLATGGGKLVKLTDVASGQVLRTIRGVEGTDPAIWGEEGALCIQALAVSSDGKLLAMGSPEELVHLWDVPSGRLLASCPQKARFLYGMAFSPDGHTLAFGADKSIYLWTLAGGQPIRKLEGHEDRVTALAFSSDGRRLASASLDQTIKLWNPKIDQEVASFEGRDPMVRGIAFAEDGDTVVSGSYDGSLKLWRAMPLSKIPARLKGAKANGSR